MNRKNGNEVYTNNTWVITAEVYSEISRTIGCRKPEQGGILGSSDGIHIDHYYHDRTADRTSASYTMDTHALNEVIHKWNDNGVQLVGIIHSHPHGVVRPSQGDMETAKNIIESIDVHGRFFTPIVQVSPKYNGEIELYPYTFEQTVELKKQPIKIEQSDPNREEERRMKEASEKAPNRFIRIERILPPEIMSRKHVIVIGCGGSREFIETLARCGVGKFDLWDADIVEDTNIATQGAYISEIGKFKCDVIKEKIQDINPLATITCHNRFLNNDVTDEEFAAITRLHMERPEDVLILGCTDDFYAQDRCAQLSFKYGVPYLAAQIFENGKGHEVIFWYPGVTSSCPRCMLASRYKNVLANPQKAEGSSAGAAVCVTDYLNSIKSYTALNILCYNERRTGYYHKLDKFADRNYLMTKCSDELTAPAFEPLTALEESETDLSFPYVTVAIEQTPENDCPLCGGRGKINNSGRRRIDDTRNLPGKAG